MHLTKSLRRKLKRIVKAAPSWPDALAQRASLAKLIAANAVAGRVVIRSGGTDCDGYRMDHGSVLPATVMHFVALRNRCADEAEGPWFCYVKTSPDREDFEAAYDCRLFGPELQFITA